MALDDSRKESLSSAEMSAFCSQTAQVKAFVREQGLYGGQSYTIFKDHDDPAAITKAAAVHKAVKTIKDSGLTIPLGLRVYCTKAYEAQNRAFSRGAKWSEVAIVILGKAALEGGRPDAMSATQANGFNKPTITCMHEIGHILNERNLGDTFWEKDSIMTGKATTGAEVSGYAAQNKKEFVAEVFAGLMLGRTFSHPCMQEYATLGGPQLP